MPDIDTTPAAKNWRAYSGDLNEAVVVAPSDGDPTDLTGATGWEAQARKTAADPVIAATATVTPGNLANGEVTVAWDGTELTALLAGAESWVGVWDLQYVAAGAALPTTMFRGTFTVLHDVTRV